MEPQWHTATEASSHIPYTRRPWQASRVPMDVQFCILDCICEDPALHDLTLACMLVCQAWAKRCVSVAYSRLHISTPRSLDDIEVRITSENGRHVRNVVVLVGLNPDHTAADVVWGDRVFRLLRRFAPHITSLRYVTISHKTTPVHIFSPHSATSRMLWSLFAAFSKLTHLSLCEYNFVDARNLLAVLHVLPELRHFEGTSLIWRRAYTTNPLSSTDLQLQSLALQTCTAVAPLLFIWTMPNGGVAPGLHFPGIPVGEMKGLMHVVGLCDEAVWKGSASISLVRDSHGDTPWTLCISGTKSAALSEVRIGVKISAAGEACNVHSIALHSRYINHTTHLTTQLKDTSLTYLPLLDSLEKITITVPATPVIAQELYAFSVSGFVPRPPIVFQQPGANHAGVSLFALEVHKGAANELLHNADELIDLGDVVKISHRISVIGLDCVYQFSRQVAARRAVVERIPLSRSKIAAHVARTVMQCMDNNNGIWRISKDIELRFEDVILLELRHVSRSSWQPVLAFERGEKLPSIELSRADLM
ncbi:hypothetical protein NM688_g5221 [Phlebia brevispora]|uniref:Uncharacterized protein n=1 Tax=Phlebia brevispora TaxID=194682 RepID=A0ACC1SZ88_9APHY|nr:hypothetical protein NM688_g5221 [Phlebia brevispora]